MNTGATIPWAIERSYRKGERPANTYNQDLHGNSLLLNIGGSENNLEETYRTADIFAEVIKDTLKRAINSL